MHLSTIFTSIIVNITNIEHTIFTREYVVNFQETMEPYLIIILIIISLLKIFLSTLQ